MSRRWPRSGIAQIEPPESTEDERLQRGLELSFAYLNRRERTVDELQAPARAQGVADRDREACLRELQAQGYVDDARYALMFVHDKRELEGWGSERIRRGLAERGIDRDLVESALSRYEAEWSTGETELDRALALLRRRFPTATPRAPGARPRPRGC